MPISYGHMHGLMPNLIKKSWTVSSDYLACTGKSFSEVLILASTKPQYDKRLFMELPQAQNMGRT